MHQSTSQNLAFTLCFSRRSTQRSLPTNCVKRSLSQWEHWQQTIERRRQGQSRDGQETTATGIDGTIMRWELTRETGRWMAYASSSERLENALVGTSASQSTLTEQATHAQIASTPRPECAVTLQTARVCTFGTQRSMAQRRRSSKRK